MESRLAATLVATPHRLLQARLFCNQPTVRRRLLQSCLYQRRLLQRLLLQLASSPLDVPTKLLLVDVRLHALSLSDGETVSAAVSSEAVQQNVQMSFSLIYALSVLSEYTLA